jgi:hypothetical protein
MQVAAIASVHVPFVGEKMQISTPSENEVAALLPVAFHDVAALVQPRLFHNLNNNVKNEFITHTCM